ncbi:nucleotide exchange factor GrpE [Eudoraea chungangensis]|uniref:nucleotide exchange factor GrpE n=1 Tax=Eudoraea chungangensis TaxID=1481905 RepID=UPI0023EB0987|nr:nucleotide exchange factor GrpE [Eudoraea chungangensis]
MSNKENIEDIEETLEQEQVLNDGELQDSELREEETPELSITEKLEEDLSKERDKFLRLFAEFENYKKRTSKERMDLFKTAGQEIMVAMLPIMDDFDRALNEISKSSDKDLFKGVELINNKFREALKGKGLQEVEVKSGDTFDAEVHDAITQIPAPDKKLKGKIIDVVEKGFKLGDKIIRHPKVVVGN